MEGFSVTASIHSRAVHTPSVDGAEQRCDRPLDLLFFLVSTLASASSISASCRVAVAAGSGVIAGNWRYCGGVESSASTAGTTRNCMI